MSIGVDIYFYNLLKKTIDDLMSARYTELLGARDFAEYKTIVGYLQALQDVLAEANSLRDRIIKN